MATIVLIPGAGGAAWYWHLVVPLLEKAGHEAVPVDLPGSDPKSGLSVYADRVLEVIGSRRDVVLVAMSLGGFTAPLVAERTKLARLVFLNAMIPVPGETAGAWGDSVRSSDARAAAAQRGGYSTAFDLETYFFHDLPRDLVRESAAHEQDEAPISFTEPCRFTGWPDVPIDVLVGSDDRLFPADFQARVARERLPPRARIERVPGGHLAALAEPAAFSRALLARLDDA